MAPTPRILIVENDRPSQKLLRLIASAENYEVETARTVAEAVHAIDRLEPDLVLLDLRLADGESGMDVLAHLKTHPRPPVVLVVSQHTELRLEALGSGAAEFHQKPIDTRVLAMALARRRDGGNA